MFIQLNFKLVSSGTLLKLIFIEVKEVGLEEATGTPFLICLIFVQFDANVAQSKIIHKFCNICNINFEKMLTLLLMPSFSTGYIKQSVRRRANVNLRQ